MRGFWGIILYEPKYIINAGAIVRSARCFNASFICTIGQRYHRDATDTGHVFDHYPGFHFATLAACLDALPTNCVQVRVEVNGHGRLGQFVHPARAAYFFGGEDRTLPEMKGSLSIYVPTQYCLNLAVCAGILMFDRTKAMENNNAQT